MKEKMSYKPDKKDLRILSILDYNARATDAEIAKKVGVSKRSVNYRIKKLMDTGMIKGFYTVIDSYSLGYIGGRICIKLKGITAKEEQELINSLKENPHVWFIVRCEWMWHFEISFFAKSNYDLDMFWNEFDRKFSNCFSQTSLVLYSHLTELNREWIYPTEGGRKIFEHYVKRKVEVDDLDINILKILSSNGRMSFSDIGKKVGTSYKTVARRVKRMQKDEIIKMFRCVFDVEKLGYKYYHIILKLDKKQSNEKLVKHLMSLPNVIYLIGVVGGDFEFEVEVKGDLELRNLIKGLIYKFPNLIEDYDSLRYYDVIRVDYFPKI